MAISAEGACAFRLKFNEFSGLAASPAHSGTQGWRECHTHFTMLVVNHRTLRVQPLIEPTALGAKSARLPTTSLLFHTPFGSCGFNKTPVVR